MVAGMFGMFFLGALYLERVLGYDPLQIGLGFLPVGVGIGALSLGASARVNARFGERNVLIGALGLIAVGLACCSPARPSTRTTSSTSSPSTVLMGVGAGLGFPAMMTLAMSDATKDDSGVASGLVNTTQQVGGALGLAVLATLATSHTNGLLAEGEVAVEAMTSGYRLAFGVAAGLVTVAVVLAVTVLRQRTPEPGRGAGAGPGRCEVSWRAGWGHVDRLLNVAARANSPALSRDGRAVRGQRAAARQGGRGVAGRRATVGRGTTRRSRQAAASALDGPLGYTEQLGIPELRDAIAGHYDQRYALDVDPMDVVATTGSSGGFLLAFLAAFDAGDRVALARPGYPAYRNILTALGCEVVELPCGADTRLPAHRRHAGERRPARRPHRRRPGEPDRHRAAGR